MRNESHYVAERVKQLGLLENAEMGAEWVVSKAAEHLCVTPRSLDYAIWKYGSSFKENPPTI